MFKNLNNKRNIDQNIKFNIFILSIN